jgi:hypothetical protein
VQRSSFPAKKRVGFCLKFFGSDLTARMGLQMHVELIELFHAGVSCGFRLNGGTEFLKVNTDAVECDRAPAVWALDSWQ